jgi:hypothetical protein
MSMKPYHYVVLGVAIPNEEFPGDPWDDKWLPYPEGETGVAMEVLSGEGSTHFYCGKILAETDPYEDYQYKVVEATEEDRLAVHKWLAEELNRHEPPQVLLCCCWH